jgi:hypothetical protein
MSRSPVRHAATTTPVDSSWIESVTYASDATLIVRFRRGTVYRYCTVPRALLEGFLTAPSKGAYFTHHIRNAFPYTQLVDSPPGS